MEEVYNLVVTIKKKMKGVIKLKRKIFTIALLALIYLPVKNAHALGPLATASGTVITNTATATYGAGLTATASASITVDNKVNVTVTNNGNATVTPGSTNQALVYVVRNDGNTTQRYALSVVNGATGIPMSSVKIYRDSATTPNAWDVTDTLYMDAGTFGDVAVDGTLNILIVADTPGGAVDGNTDDYSLVATTVDAGTTNVTLQTDGANTANVDVVFADVMGSAAGDGARNGKHSASGRYTVSSLTLTVAKAVFVYSDPSNGVNNGTAGSNYTDCTVCPKAIPTATLRYTITVTVTGSGTALNVVITDPIPANTTYAAGTLKLNGAPLSDTSGNDAGDVGGTTVGTVTVNLGPLTSVPADLKTITFDVTIN